MRDKIVAKTNENGFFAFKIDRAESSNGLSYHIDRKTLIH